MAALKPNSKNIFYFVKEHESEGIIAQDIADALGLTAKQVNGSVTAFQKKGLMVRTETERLIDGKHKPVKEITLTDDGRAFDPESAE